MKRFVFLTYLLLLSLSLTAQKGVVVSGRVMDVDSDETLVGAQVAMKGKIVGTVTDTDGNFQLLTGKEELPLTLIISMPSYGTKEVLVNGPTNILVVRLKYQALMLGEELVISASRVEESVLESPVTIEKMDIRDIRAAAALSFYDQIANLKGIDVSTQSLTFRTINPRGFASNGNFRTVQLIDGIDNQPPAINYPVSNIVGVPEIDLESIEIIPGAASALYGPNALNGIILMSSKSPFEYQGLSVLTRLGVNHVDGEDRDPALYQNYALRYARTFNDRWAFKLSGEFLRAADFQAVDYRDQQNAVERSDENTDPYERGTNRTYDGVNVYGDPLVNLGLIAQNTPELASVRALLPLGEIGDFTPTGYTESDLLEDYRARNLKLGAALHYRVSDDIEALAQYNFGTGNSLYTGGDRFVPENFSLQTAKVELRSTNFFLRAYTTQSNAGDTYGLNTVAARVNAQTTIPRYVEDFTGARLQGLNVDQAHRVAREASDALRAQNLATGRFRQLYDSLRAIPISAGGARFVDRTNLWHGEGMYNFSNITDAVEIIAGANFRRYALNSEGTLFALQDDGEEFRLDEWGVYVQASKDLFNDKLDLTASVRYDKNENFRGQFSPRVSGVYTLVNDHNLRASVQRGFRIPTTQEQLVDLDEGNRRLIGRNPVIVDRYNLTSNQVYQTTSVIRAQENFRNTGNVASAIALLEPVPLDDFETEKVTTFELGYRGVISDNLFIDAYYYYSVYNDFLVDVNAIQSAGPANDPQGDNTPPFEGEADLEGLVQDDINLQRFASRINIDRLINTQGVAVGLDYVLARGFTVGGNVTYNELLDRESLRQQGIQTGFNTPKWRYNLKLTNRKVTDNFGFSLFWRWQDAFYWETAFAEGVVPAYQTLDAQVSYKLSRYKSIVKLGGANVFNDRYITSVGNPTIGAIYYISITFDEFLN